MRYAGKRHFLNLNVLVVVCLQPARHEVFGEICVHELGAEAGRRPEAAEYPQVARGVADFFGEFALRAVVRVFAVFYDARGTFEQVLLGSVAVLAD